MFSCKGNPVSQRNHKMKKGQKTIIFRMKKLTVLFAWMKQICKKMSVCLFSGRKSEKGKCMASMTVEAALVLPLCLFAIVNLLSIIEIYRLQSSLSASMHKTAKEMAVYAHQSEIDSSLIGSLYAGNKIENDLGEIYLKQSPLMGGSMGINWMSSEYMVSDCIDLIAEYRVEPAFGLMGFDSQAMCNRSRTRAWTGYDNAGSSLENGSEPLVYITPNGSAYHLSRNCSYLRLSIQGVEAEHVNDLRNQDGSIYYACEECGGDCKGTVFITDYGSRYHSTLRCSKLKRTICLVPLSQAAGRNPCSKCKGE